MKKLNLLQLNDYISSPTPLNLSLFASGLNVEFKLDVKHKKELSELINKYVNDKSPARLKIIENYIGSNSKEVKTTRVKPSELKAAKENKLTPKQAEDLKEKSEANDKMEKLRNQIMLYRRQPASTRSVQTESELQGLLRELFKLETEAGMYDPVPPEKSKLDSVFAMFGHWEDPESLAYELRFGNRQVIEIQTSDNVRGVFEDMMKLSGKEFRQFYITNNIMQGGAKGFREKWTLTDARSGVKPKSNNYSNMVDGAESDVNILGVGSQIAGPVNLGTAGWTPKQGRLNG